MASWNIAGLAVISDWIGSDIEYCPYINNPMSLLDYWRKFALPQAKKTLSIVGWKFHNVREISGNTIVRSLFPFIREPNSLQSLIIDLPILEGPELFIIEDMTGAGKTEASIILSSRIMNSGNADGIYIGLPTMATANAMYERMKNSYTKLYEAGERPSLILSHGARHLAKEFTDRLNTIT